MLLLSVLRIRALASVMLLCLTAFITLPNSAEAVPSFARQTGLACEACHTVFPELTPFGRRFKLNGYVLTTRSAITDMDFNKHNNLTIQDLPPLSIMVQASSSWTNKAVGDSVNTTTQHAQNGVTEFPQQLSMFYAGKIADNMGAFFQVTYQQASGSFGIDNSDIRLTDHSENNDLIYGITLNNNPTVQDVWNSTPGWGFPFYTAPSAIPTPSAKPLLSNTLGGNVGGVGAYMFYMDSFYLEASAYRSALQGTGSVYDSTTANSVIDGVAPYWRAAYEHQWGKNSLELGTFGMRAKYITANNSYTNTSTNAITQTIGSNSPDTYLDMAGDMQFQHIGDNHILTLLGTYIHEHIDHNLSSFNPTAATAATDLNSYQAAATYYYRRRYGGSVGFTKITGTSDSIMYPAGATTGSGKNSPDSQYETIELDYMPWLNTKILAQYTIYNQFNGGSLGYDGTTGRKASDNNTAMLAMWIAF